MDNTNDRLIELQKQMGGKVYKLKYGYAVVRGSFIEEYNALNCATRARRFYPTTLGMKRGVARLIASGAVEA